jgi:hypothetical protein
VRIYLYVHLNSVRECGSHKEDIWNTADSCGPGTPQSDRTETLKVVAKFETLIYLEYDRFCGLVVRVPGYRSRGPGSIPGSTRFSE